MRARTSAMGLIAAVGLVGFLSKPPAPRARDDEGPILPRPLVLHVLGAAQQTLIADYYWLLTIEQIGSAKTPAAHRDIYPYANLTTDLDRSFRLAYLYAATVIPLDLGREHWVNEAESTALIRKGLEVFPHDYQLRFMLAYNLQYITKQYAQAAKVVEDLAHEPGAPSWLNALATRLYAQAGQFDSGLALAETLRDAATDPQTRAFFELRIEQIQQEQLLKELDAAAARFHRREGRRPASMAELFAAGDLTMLPTDPMGGSLFFDSSGRAQSSSSRHRLELYDAGKGDGEP